MYAIAWEDIDLKAGTYRVVVLINATFDVLRDQARLTRLGKQYDVDIVLREYKKKEVHKCTFVFNPSIHAKNGKSGHHYAVGSVNQRWEAAMRRAGIRYRKAYQSRYTYACWLLSAGANPNYVALQMGHSDSQMVHRVYGAWMIENDSDQLNIINDKLNDLVLHACPAKAVI